MSALTEAEAIAQYFGPRHKRVYISGPMTGYPAFNYPAFNETAARWRAAKWYVENPAENFDGRTDLAYSTYIREDIAMLRRVDAIALLPGWEHSEGAKLEILLASKLGLECYDAHDCVNPRSMPRIITTVVA